MPTALGGVPCPLRRRIAVPSEKQIRTLLVVKGNTPRLQPRHKAHDP
jgi:hypothetical protein